jgi:hypothetical protein
MMVMAKRPEDIAEYIEDLAMELAMMARQNKLPITAYLLEMAATDARHGGQPPVEPFRRSEPSRAPH